jgi:hypothetical protein
LLLNNLEKQLNCLVMLMERLPVKIDKEIETIDKRENRDCPGEQGG